MKALPAGLERLRALAYNLHWTWHPEALALFARLDPDRWEQSNHNPIRTIDGLDDARLRALADDPAFLAELARAADGLDAYLAAPATRFTTMGGAAGGPCVAYFSMEFGLHESLPIYSGGLGVLAGDHLKSASDLGVPLVAVGLFYAAGYFRQRLDHSGWQEDGDERNVPGDLPLVPVLGPDGAPLTVEVTLEGRRALLRAWLARVGRVDLYLLDAGLPENAPEDRRITERLYGGEIGVRIRQEIALGIGGARLLEALGLGPTVYHLNEGHAAFLILELARRAMEREGLDFAAARERIGPQLVFTTHTPVAAGHDYFSPELLERHLGGYVGQLGIAPHELLGLGRHNPDDYREYFCMTILALKSATRANGVSRLHGEVSRRQWRGLWPDRAETDVPIGHITNGVHLPSFIAPEMAALYARHLGIAPGTVPAEPAAWAPVVRVPDAELWAARNASRSRLLTFIRGRSPEQAARQGGEGRHEGFDPDALTIGFARRFATYKRATLLLRDPARLARILNNTKRPVQLVFAGKAHPRDDGGKLLIQRLAQLAGDDTFRHRILFLEGYDIGVARQLVQGVDVWLNTPQRPYEASGTSGMKAAANGALNCSILDGWWAEAWEESQARGEEIGWAIGGTVTSDNAEHQAHLDAAALYDLLECELVPAFYERGLDGVPHGWTARMKRSIAAIAPRFNTARMVREYTEHCYLPALGARAD
ncbi:MAG TPA: alpha-glucan family phosphorylase [Thermomicrobiales bacterium]|jgi:starch phosphorylase